MNESVSDRRHPIIPFDDSLLQSVFVGCRIESIGLFRQGRSNTNYRVALDDGRTLVLRLHADGSGARERAALSLVRGTVPVPRVVRAGEGWSLLSLVPGVSLAERPEWTRQAARALVPIWSTRFPSRGWIEADGSVSPFEFGDASGFFDAMLRHPSVCQWLDQATIERLADMVDDQVGDDAAEQPGCLVHGDFNPSNILVLEGRVTGILDWEFAHAGEPFMDIANLVRYTPAAYLDDLRLGIEEAGFTLPDDWEARCEQHRLGSYLEFLTTSRSDAFKRECVRWIRAYASDRCRGADG